MKFSQKAQAAMNDPNAVPVNIELTPERKERYTRISAEVIDLLHKHVGNPVEAYMILHFVMESFEQQYGIRGGVIIEHEETGKS